MLRVYVKGTLASGLGCRALTVNRVPRALGLAGGLNLRAFCVFAEVCKGLS